jgi:hypothetical protein
MGSHLTDIKTRGKRRIRFEKARVNSQTLKRRGKITIDAENRGRNTNLPHILY